VKSAIKKALPRPVLSALRGARERMRARFIRSLAPMSEATLLEILTGPLGIGRGDLVMVHASLDILKVDFPPQRVLDLLREATLNEGTLLFLAYPLDTSALELLSSGKVFKAKRTPSGAGLLPELARRAPGAVRSLHPIRSACAIGPLAEYLTRDHAHSLYPFGEETPYGRLVTMDGMVVGLGVTTMALSVVHCVEDFMGDAFPVKKHLDDIGTGKCVDADGVEQLVQTYVSNPQVEPVNIRKFAKRYVSPEICCDIQEQRRPFFRCRAKPFVDRLRELAQEGITLYPRSLVRPSHWRC